MVTSYENKQRLFNRYGGGTPDGTEINEGGFSSSDYKQIMKDQDTEQLYTSSMPKNLSSNRNQIYSLGLNTNLQNKNSGKDFASTMTNIPKLVLKDRNATLNVIPHHF